MNIRCCRLTIARTPVIVRAERRVAPFVFRPFAHLKTEVRQTPELTVDVLEMTPEDVENFELDTLGENGAIQVRGDRVIQLDRHSIVAIDRDQNRIRALLRDPAAAPFWQRAKPLQLPLTIFFADRGIDLLHAALVSENGAGVLVAGMGGSGKSTIAMQSLLEGLDFLGDDCVGVGVAGDGFEGYSIFGSSCLDRGDAAAKEIVPVAEMYADRMVASTSIRAVVLPRITHSDHVTAERTTAKEALLALAPSSLLKRALPAAEALTRMANLVSAVPAFRLEMGPMHEIGPRIRALIEELAA